MLHFRLYTTSFEIIVPFTVQELVDLLPISVSQKIITVIEPKKLIQIKYCCEPTTYERKECYKDA